MLIILGVSVVALVGWKVFDRIYPKPQARKVDDFKPNPVFSGTNFISPNPKTWDHKSGAGRYRAYKFQCSISPNTAMVMGRDVEMKIPIDYKITEFTILASPKNNEVHYVHLGTTQYHCDLDPVSHCLCIQELYRETLDQEFLKKLMGMMLTYEILDSYRSDHWENEEFIKINQKIVEALEDESDANILKRSVDATPQNIVNDLTQAAA
jgi:hypothetical protein